MTLDQTIAAIAAAGITIPTALGAVWWVGNLQTRLKHAEERIGDLRALSGLPAALESLGDKVSHGLEMVGLEMKNMNDRFVEHTAQDEKRFTHTDNRLDDISDQIGAQNGTQRRKRVRATG